MSASNQEWGPLREQVRQLCGLRDYLYEHEIVAFVARKVEEEKRKARLEEAKIARNEFDEHFYPGSNDPEGLKECLDARISKLEAS